MNSWAGKMLLTVLAVSIATILVTKFSPPIPISSVVTQKENLFTVEGVGKVTVVPDEAVISVGITTSKTTVKEAQKNANQVITKITDSLKGLGIETRDIKTENYSIYPQYDYRNAVSRITGYQVNASLAITVRNLDNINQVIDLSTVNGANTVGNIQLTVNEDRQKELLKQAREQAVKEAKTKAESLAAAAGIALGRIVNIQESGTPSPRPLYLTAKDMAASPQVGGGTEIQPGSTDITTTIVLSYETR